MRGSSQSFSPGYLLQRLNDLPIPDGGCYRIAFSGGLDSTALLYSMAAVANRLPAPVTAVHVDHGLSEYSAQWAEQCAGICRRLNIPLDIAEVSVGSFSGQSLEAAAREARYGAIAELMTPGDALVTAHHEDDQAETLLLRLLRGTGVRGAAAMAPAVEFAGGWLLRPLLGVPRRYLKAYAAERDLSWIDDPSNFDTGFDRNLLRGEVIPRLTGRWPAATRLLARSASHFGEAAVLLADLARLDLGSCRGERPDTLSVSALKGLTERRVRNLLRYWLEGNGLGVPDTVHLERILREVIPARPDAEPEVVWDSGQVRRYRDDLYAVRELPDIPDSVLPWSGEQPVELPSGLGRLRTEPAAGKGVRRSAIIQGRAEIRFRRGGERCRPAGRNGERPVKKLLQEAAVPPWERRRLPLLYIDDRLAAVVGICVCEPFVAGSGEQGLLLEWERKAIET